MFLSLPASVAALCLQFAWDVPEWDNWLSLPMERRLQKAINQQDDGIIASLILGHGSPFDRPILRSVDATALEDVELNLRPLVKSRRFRHVVNLLCRYGWTNSELQESYTGVDIIQNGDLRDVQCLLSAWPFFLSDQKSCDTNLTFEQILDELVRSKHTHILQWIHDFHDGLVSFWPQNTFKFALRNGDVNMLKCLVRLTPEFRHLHTTFQYLLDHKYLNISHTTICDVITGGHLSMLQLFKKMRPHLRFEHSQLLAAFHSGRLKIFRWLRTFIPMSTNQWAECFRTIDRPEKVLPILKEVAVHIEDFNLVIPSILRRAVSQGSFDVVHWLCSFDSNRIVFHLSDIFQSRSVEMGEFVANSIFQVISNPSEDVRACIATDQVVILKRTLAQYGVEFFTQDKQNPLHLALEENVGPEVMGYLLKDLGFTTLQSDAWFWLEDVKVLELLYAHTSFGFRIPQYFEEALNRLCWPVVEYCRDKHPVLAQWSLVWESFLRHFGSDLQHDRSFCFKTWHTIYRSFPDILNSSGSWKIAANQSRPWFLHLLVEEFNIPRELQHLVVRAVFRTNNIYLTRCLLERHPQLDNASIILHPNFHSIQQI